jgi:hypothetical protein
LKTGALHENKEGIKNKGRTKSFNRWRRPMRKAVTLGNSGETGVLKDAAGLGVLLVLIASVQLLSFLVGA